VRAKIRVHVFSCVLSLAVAHLMRRQAHQGGLDLSVRELLTTLGGIQETVLLYPPGTKAGPAPNASSPTPTPPKNAYTTCSASTPTPRNADMGNTLHRPPHPP